MGSDIVKVVGFLLGTTFMYATPLIYTAIGAVYSENSGVVNIGLEGMMTIGAFTGAAVAVLTGNPWLAFIAAGLAGGLFGLIHAIACVKFNAAQVVSGIAINFLAPGIALFASRRIFNGATMTPSVPLEQKLPRPLNGFFSNLAESGANPEMVNFFDTIFNQYITVYIAIAIVFVTWYILYKTKLGLRIRAVGEHPKAADTVGVNVYGIRYFCVTISGVLAGLGGASLSLAIVSNFRPGLVSGQGFIALAAMIFGKWKPRATMMACLLFGVTKGLQIFLGGPMLGWDVSIDLLAMLPYVITLVVLISFVGKSVAPAASGQPYEVDER